MKLNVDVWDVEITTGKLTHHQDRVALRFRRQPDTDVVNDLFSLRSEYGWQVRDFREADRIMKTIMDDADFIIDCVCADSIEVGNSLADYLLEKHGLKTCFIQRLECSQDSSAMFRVKRLHNPTDITPEDVALH